MDENVDKLIDGASDAVSLLSGEEAARWFDLTGWKVRSLIVLVVLVVLIWLTRKVRRFLRRRRPPTLHPKLQKYGQSFAEPDPKLGAKRRKEAAEILAQRPEAMQLRYLSAVSDIAGERSNTIVFPLPLDFMRAIGGGKAPEGADGDKN